MQNRCEGAAGGGTGASGSELAAVSGILAGGTGTGAPPAGAVRRGNTGHSENASQYSSTKPAIGIRNAKASGAGCPVLPMIFQ